MIERVIHPNFSRLNESISQLTKILTDLNTKVHTYTAVFTIRRAIAAYFDLIVAIAAKWWPKHSSDYLALID